MTREDAHHELAQRVRRMFCERFDHNSAMEFLEDATGGDMYVWGGTLRRALFHDTASGDVDIILPNGDNRALEVLDAHHVPFVLNRNGHRRYRWNYLELDIYHPSEWFGGYDTVLDVLQFSDLKINALAFHWCSGEIQDPFHVVSGHPVTDPGINWQHWDCLSDRVVILAIRLTKVLYEIPSLRIPRSDGERLMSSVVPRIHSCDWSSVQQRFPLGKAAFIRMFEDTVLARVSLSG